MKRLRAIRVEDELWNAFVKKYPKTASEEIRRFIRTDLNGLR